MAAFAKDDDYGNSYESNGHDSADRQNGDQIGRES